MLALIGEILINDEFFDLHAIIPPNYKCIIANFSGNDKYLISYTDNKKKIIYVSINAISLTTNPQQIHMPSLTAALQHARACIAIETRWYALQSKKRDEIFLNLCDIYYIHLLKALPRYGFLLRGADEETDVMYYIIADIVNQNMFFYSERQFKSLLSMKDLNVKSRIKYEDMKAKYQIIPEAIDQYLNEFQKTSFTYTTWKYEMQNTFGPAGLAAFFSFDQAFRRSMLSMYKFVFTPTLAFIYYQYFAPDSATNTILVSQSIKQIYAKQIEKIALNVDQIVEEL